MKAVLTVVVSLDGAGRTSGARAAGSVPKQVLGFYYGWYGTPGTTGQWRHWTSDEKSYRLSNSTGTPTNGPYDSLDPGQVNAQVKLAKQAGLTGLIASCWGEHGFEDASLAQLLEAAQQTGLKVSAYLEQVKGSGESELIKSAVTQLLYLLHVPCVHPSWLRVDSKPVIFIYDRAYGALTKSAWETVLRQVRRETEGGLIVIGPAAAIAKSDAFDGGHEYNFVGAISGKSDGDLRNWATIHYADMTTAVGSKVACATVIPGYDDTPTGRPLPRPIIGRSYGQNHGTLWEAAIAAKPNWILVTSWNEWHEGTEIYASTEYPSLYIEETANMQIYLLNSTFFDDARYPAIVIRLTWAAMKGRISDRRLSARAVADGRGQ